MRCCYASTGEESRRRRREGTKPLLIPRLWAFNSKCWAEETRVQVTRSHAGHNNAPRTPRRAARSRSHTRTCLTGGSAPDHNIRLRHNEGRRPHGWLSPSPSSVRLNPARASGAPTPALRGRSHPPPVSLELTPRTQPSAPRGQPDNQAPASGFSRVCESRATHEQEQLYKPWVVRAISCHRRDTNPPRPLPSERPTPAAGQPAWNSQDVRYLFSCRARGGSHCHIMVEAKTLWIMRKKRMPTNQRATNKRSTRQFTN